MILQEKPIQFPMVLIIGNNLIDNFIHSKVIELTHLAEDIVVKETIESAIDFLTLLANKVGKLPEHIFVDVSWIPDESKIFFDWFTKLPSSIRNKSKIIVLSLYANEKAKIVNYVFIEKPLTVEKLKAIKWV